MHNSKFKFFASTSHGLESALLRDLKSLDIKCFLTNAFGKRVIEFRSDLYKICEVMLKVRTIEEIKMMVGRPMHCGNEKGLKNLLVERTNFSAFWDKSDPRYEGKV
jgi:23S rRNA G2445 N2-methylase RlmL